MDFKTTFTKSGARRRLSGAALVEIMFAIGIAALLVAVICSFTLFSGRSFAALFNYVDLNDSNRTAMDQITRDVRQASRVTHFDTLNGITNSVTLLDSDGSTLVYTYSPTQRTLKRTMNGVSKVILRDCDQLAFSLGQRNTVAGGYDVYAAATAATCKVVNVAWVCSRTIFGRKENTESVQTARIVIRKQGS